MFSMQWQYNATTKKDNTYSTLNTEHGWLGSVKASDSRSRDRDSRVRLQAGALSGSLGQLSLPSFQVGKLSTSLLAGVKAGRVQLRRAAGKNTVWSHMAADAP